MEFFLGMDVGTVSAKWAFIGARNAIEALAAKEGSPVAEVYPFPDDPAKAIAVSSYRRIQGRPLEASVKLLGELFEHVSIDEIGGAIVTGSAAKLVGGALDLPVENEFKAAAIGVGTLYRDVVNIFEMGGENSKFIHISNENGQIGIVDYETNGDCAAGTGSFMDQQSTRLRYQIEDVGDIVLAAERTPKIAGRCSVFAKSDMIHAQQKGYKPDEVLKGLCESVARNFKSNIARGKSVHGKTAFIGGVALNMGVAGSLASIFELDEKDFFVPKEGVHVAAIGAAIISGGGNGRGTAAGALKRDLNKRTFDAAGLKERLAHFESQAASEFPALKRLTRDHVLFLRDRVDTYNFDGRKLPVDAYLGIDIGSVSTNLTLIDDDGLVIKEIYLRTQARPIEIVHEGLQEIEREVGAKVRIRGVGTTGSGRELIGELIGADTIVDEITAHKTGAAFIGDAMIGKKVDTIFEIGGQDAKFISIADGIVVDFTMNEACAAGTGSFLEEQAEKLDVNIVNEFAELAFSSERPLRLGERCTVYMEQDVSAYLKKGAAKNDIIAGLAYSVVQNYLNRVVRGRKIGSVIFFQGGTAYNDAVAAAFSEVLGQEIIVPPYNGVIGAIGASLLVREKVQALRKESGFRGYDLTAIDYKLREFTCPGCTNYCDIQEFNVEGNKTYWGDKCSDRYRKRAKVPRKPTIPNLMTLYNELIERDWLPLVEKSLGRAIDTSAPGASGAKPRIGVARSMYFYDRHPFWGTYLRALGAEIVLSPRTNKKIAHQGIEAAVAEPCFPIQVAHGHILALLEQGVDGILAPNVIDGETDAPEVKSYMCPWGQTLPFVLKHAPLLEGKETLMMSPLVHFREGENFVEKELRQYGKRFRVSRARHRLAVRAGYAAQRMFREECEAAGREALDILEKSGEAGVILVGRPYNVIDKEANLDVPGKLRDYYGMNVIPIFFLPLEGIGIRDINDNMFWSFGRKILQTARLAAQKENLHLIYITNFKCGPDSYVKHYASGAAVRPYLTLQFDGHSNDAGVMTRCEAYLDSKGVLRWWKKSEGSKAARSTSPACRTREHEPSPRPSDILE
ncbi:MAG: acyl-CoA dehydratase activase [Candidatus Krumholzibacteria bacterium]|nr:acyl-CoA dehydratase activase [Candidatus Krumholzibacteria bacterium]